MPKSRTVSRSITSNRPLHMTLNLECIEEPLSESQLKQREKLQEDCNKVATTLEQLVMDHGGKMICQSGTVNGYQYTLPPNTSQPIVKNTQPLLNVNQNKSQQIKLNMVNNTNGTQGNIQLVVDPRVGVILGSVNQQQGSNLYKKHDSFIINLKSFVIGNTTTTTASPTSVSAQSQSENYKYTRSGRRTKVLQVQQQPDIIEEPAPLPARGRPKSNTTTHVVTSSVTNLRIKTVNKSQGNQTTLRSKPTEQTSIGGISVGIKNTACEQIDESKKNLPDGREITFNKMNGGRTFPSLVVVARPNLRTKEIIPQVALKERSELDIKVKGVLMYSPTKFAEWLIQQGLVRSEQYCILHSTTYQRVKLKLGMYSDQGTFPYSGGYVWISNCCPDRFISIFSGSIFQGAPYTPTVLLKLIYHWACQTNVQNVVSWVKVSNIYVKNFYTNLRSACTAAIWDKSRRMGGKNSMIQVGVISLGTTSQDGNLRQVKVEVLGVLDMATLDLRLRACDPVQDGERSYKRRFNNILHPLKDWVHTDSKIMTDFTVDKSTLQELGFANVTQSAFCDQNPRNFMSNYHVMEYLRKIVPRMFQNTLSLLSRQMIQQFLDELVWREMYGATAARAFDNIILHISEQTKIDSSDCMLERLAKIAANPFQDWSYSKTNPPPLTPMIMSKDQPQTNPEIIVQNIKQSESHLIKPGPKRGRKRVLSTRPSPEPEVKKNTSDTKIIKEKERENKTEQIQLQKCYYATMDGDKSLLLKENKSSLYFKCFLCTAVMRSNTEIMEHMISHVPPQVPDQSEFPVCRYCCTAFSSTHQVVTHISEAHSTFGNSDGDMVVCAICEQKFGNSNLLINHLTAMHCPSEMPYQCDNCGYRTSSHKDVIDHYYQVHEKGEGLQCPYCLKIIEFIVEGQTNASSIHSFFLHMQRHIVRREQGRGNKCPRCCLWFNQKSSLKIHQRELHDSVTNSKVISYSTKENEIMIPKQRPLIRRFDVESPVAELPKDEYVKKWSTGPILVNASTSHLPCQECEEDIDEQDHYPGEQRCQQCRYVTCCWRAFKEHLQQIHNERPKTSSVVPSPLINIPLEKKMQCRCGYTTNDGNQLAAHLIKCNKMTAYPIEESVPSGGMLDSLGLVPKNASDTPSIK
ncbi:uncharacterized protein LOC118451481 isoform X2 [Vespa mandarinia]|uniref:uncharacterized protein LOC118451481 isoform X2 n=1 Tax=Vespa mandarinia TaxID=7446 RepID=UPI0016131EA9|nr:uncharacterized protein LOC118451481 isoform X2 [Vespa mandarinia]